MKRILIAIACLVYVLSPIDLIIDPLPIIGWLDDVAVVVLTVRQFLHEGAQGPKELA